MEAHGMKRLCLMMLCVLVLSVAAQGASFDCGKAATKVEKLICADTETSKLDREMQSAYQDAYKHTADPVGLKLEQRRWLRVRNVCRDTPCLARIYRARLARLNEILSESQPCFRLLERQWPEVQSGHYPVCLAYLKSLNHFCAEPPPTCERKLDPTIKELSLPKWEEIDPKAYLEVIAQMLTSPSYRVTQVWRPLNPEIKARILEGKTQMWQAWIDLDHDGKVEHVVRFGDGGCMSGARTKQGLYVGGNYHLAVVDEHITQVDIRFDYLGVGEVLLYDGRAYLFKESFLGMGLTFSLEEPFRVSVTDTGNAESVCVFQYLK
jgi:uncharacterized protein